MYRDVPRSAFSRNWQACLTVGLACLWLLPAGACRGRRLASRETVFPPDANLLLITVDTTRADYLSCYAGLRLNAGRPYCGPQTPHLDALAQRGVRFTHATVQAPLTLPSHASIMTGEYPTQHGLRNMEGFVLAGSHPTIASIVQANGYATAAILGSRALARSFGLARGFTVYDDDLGDQDYTGQQRDVLGKRPGAIVTDHAIEWLKTNSQSKFFLWAHYYDPHTPYDPPEPYQQRYASDPYAGEVAYMDEQVGRLLDGLDTLGLRSRTLVAVIGDHGEGLGDHGEPTHGVFLYESTLHVPLILAGPGVPSGAVVSDQVRSIDVAPTLLSYLGLAAGLNGPGVSLWPLIQQGVHVRSNYSYSETIFPRYYMGWSELRAMRTDRWKLIVAPRPELYNLESDPGETNNLIAKFPADADQLQKKLWEATGAPGRQEKIATTPVDRQTREELESLGYASAGMPRAIQLGGNAADPKDRVNVLALQVEAEKATGERRYAEAARLMEQALRLDPTNPRSHIYLGKAYDGMGQYARAIQVYQHALAAKLEDDRIYASLGTDYIRLHKLADGVAALAHANQINPADLESLRNLGIACMQLGRDGEAEKAFKAILTQDNHYAPAYDGLGLLALQHGDTESAQRDFESALQVDPREVIALLDLGMLYQKIGNPKQALRYYQSFLARAPKAQFGSQFPTVRAAIQKLKASQN